jgi:hypothetical protein
MENIIKKFKRVIGDMRFFSADMPSRDTTGECIGECRNRVHEGDVERQREINVSGVEEIQSYPSVKAAYKRTEPPGFLDGHV